MRPSPDALLTGELPCITCGYELKGLSVRDVCPECGTAVRATILHAVDPLADEFAPLRSPSVTGVLIVTWALCSALGISLMILMHLLDGLGMLGLEIGRIWWSWDVAMVLLVCSGVCTIGFWAPTVRTRRRATLCAVMASLAYVPLFIGMSQVRLIDRQLGVAGSYYSFDPSPERILWRFLLGFCLVVVFLGVRPNARELVRRSLALRTGRVDRQTLYALASVSAVAMIGDAMRLAGVGFGGGAGEALVLSGSLVVLVATVFLALGMWAATVDGARIRRSLRLGPKRLRDLVTEPPPDAPAQV